MKRVKNVLSVVAILMVASRACGVSSSDGEPMVGRHSFVVNGPEDQDTRFGGLRTVGAFPVSAEVKKGVVSGMKIVSEKRRDCTVVNPWPGSKVTLVRPGRRPGCSAETKQGERFSFKTEVNQTIELSPEQ